MKKVITVVLIVCMAVALTIVMLTLKKPKEVIEVSSEPVSTTEVTSEAMVVTTVQATQQPTISENTERYESILQKSAVAGNESTTVSSDFDYDLSNIEYPQVRNVIIQLHNDNAYTSYDLRDAYDDVDTMDQPTGIKVFIVKFDDDYYVIKFDGEKAYALKDTTGAFNSY